MCPALTDHEREVMSTSREARKQAKAAGEDYVVEEDDDEEDVAYMSDEDVEEVPVARTDLVVASGFSGIVFKKQGMDAVKREKEWKPYLEIGRAAKVCVRACAC